MKIIVQKADMFAEKAHQEVGQVRKYSKEPYIVHPRAVRKIMLEFAVYPISSEQEAAALLHDTVEDTNVTLEMILNEFGETISKLVDDLTDISIPSDGNRKFRRAKDLEHTKNASPSAKTVKLADIIHNVGSIVEGDPGFAPIYLREKLDQLEVLKEGDSGLYAEAYRVVHESIAKLNVKIS